MANETKKENYSAVVTGNALQQSKNGSDSVAIQVQTIANLATGDEIEKTFVSNLYITPSAVDRTIKTLRDAFDYKANSFLPLNDPNTLLGKQCEITVSYEEYNGEIRPKVQWFNAPGSFAAHVIKPVPAAIAQAIAARNDGYFFADPANHSEAQGLGNHNPYSRANSAPAYSEPGDDLPF